MYGILVGKLERIDDLEDLEIDGSIILKLALEIGWETWTEFFWLNEGTCGNCFWSQT